MSKSIEDLFNNFIDEEHAKVFLNFCSLIDEWELKIEAPPTFQVLSFVKDDLLIKIHSSESTIKFILQNLLNVADAKVSENTYLITPFIASMLTEFINKSLNINQLKS